jgi:hypothetical protein
MPDFLTRARLMGPLLALDLAFDQLTLAAGLEEAISGRRVLAFNVMTASAGTSSKTPTPRPERAAGRFGRPH